MQLGIGEASMKCSITGKHEIIVWLQRSIVIRLEGT